MAKHSMIKISAVGLIGSALLLAGCTSSSNATKPTSAATSPSSTAASSAPASPVASSSSAKAPVVGDPTVLPIKNNVTRRAQAAVRVCSGDSTGWTATGTAKNPDAGAHTYTLTVYFSNTKGTVIGSGKTTKTVAGKATGTWTVSAKFAAPAKVNCVLVSVQ
jgi:hypothetical protein